MNFSKAETVDVRVFEFLAETFSSPQSELVCLDLVPGLGEGLCLGLVLGLFVNF